MILEGKRIQEKARRVFEAGAKTSRQIENPDDSYVLSPGSRQRSDARDFKRWPGMALWGHGTRSLRECHRPPGKRWEVQGWVDLIVGMKDVDVDRS